MKQFIDLREAGFEHDSTRGSTRYIARATEGDTNRGGRQSRAIVDAVTHIKSRPLLVRLADELEFLLGRLGSQHFLNADLSGELLRGGWLIAGKQHCTLTAMPGS